MLLTSWFPAGVLTIGAATDPSSIQVPFSFRVVPSPSAAPVQLVVAVQNELSFFDPAKPLLAGAAVALRDDQGNTVASATSNANGTATFPGLLEGFYTITASAVNHSSASKVLPPNREISSPPLFTLKP